MCGIAGILDFKGSRVSSSVIEEMNRAQRHRGPDDWGGVLLSTEGAPPLAWSERSRAPLTRSRIGLGHVRLSIIDLTDAGHQPMSSEDAAHWLVYNGEVYNYLELRSELEGLGFQFRTRTDTEVVLAAYKAWGLDAFRRFNGMWGLALWDSTTQQLICVRDRFGIKPFHYAEGDGMFAFASEIPALLTVGNVERDANGEVLARFLTWAEMPSPELTFFADIKRLPAGHMLIVTPNGNSQLSRWWSPPMGQVSLTDSELAEGIRSTVLDAVRLRLRSDVPVGVCLSGGLDSSSIACAMQHVRGSGKPSRIRAFTARFRDPRLDETMYAEQVVQAVDAQWHVIEPESRALREGDLLRLIRAQAEPFPNLSMYAQFCVFRRMREEGVPVALDGQGADELFWGYTWHYAFALSQLAQSGRLARLSSEAAAILRNNHLTSKSRLLMSLGYYGIPFARELRAKFSNNDGLTPLCRKLAGESQAFRTRSVGESRHREVFVDPLPALLRYEDRNSMAFSIESRLPFLDYRLVEQVLQVPEHRLIRGGWSKALLRDAMEGIVPEPIRWRRSKLGFDAPSARLFSEVAPMLRDAFSSPRSSSFVSPRAVLTRLDDVGPLPAWAARATIVEFWMREHRVGYQGPLATGTEG